MKFMHLTKRTGVRNTLRAVVLASCAIVGGNHLLLEYSIDSRQLDIETVKPFIEKEITLMQKRMPKTNDELLKSGLLKREEVSAVLERVNNGANLEDTEGIIRNLNNERDKRYAAKAKLDFIYLSVGLAFSYIVLRILGKEEKID